MKIATLCLGLVAVVGLGIGLENIGKTKRDCEVYQGYTLIDDRVNYVFDPEKEYNRVGSPKYSLEGDSKLIDSLKIGERYCFELKEPTAPWASRKLKSVSLEPHKNPGNNHEKNQVEWVSR